MHGCAPTTAAPFSAVAFEGPKSGARFMKGGPASFVDAKKDGEPPTIFDMLLQRQKETIRPLESYSLFVGPKGGGKSSLLALLQPAGTVRDTPKPTVALEYVFARRSKNTSTLKDVAHIWELGGGMKGDGVAELVGVPITTARLPTAVLAIVLDLSKPQNVIPACLHWLKMLRTHVQSRLDDLRTSGSSDLCGNQPVCRVHPTILH